jgi:hypothetical protein
LPIIPVFRTRHSNGRHFYKQNPMKHEWGNIPCDVTSDGGRQVQHQFPPQARPTSWVEGVWAGIGRRRTRHHANDQSNQER